RSGQPRAVHDEATGCCGVASPPRFPPDLVWSIRFNPWDADSDGGARLARLRSHRIGGGAWGRWAGACHPDDSVITLWWHPGRSGRSAAPADRFAEYSRGLFGVAGSFRFTRAD